jgi:hypothetical protein
MDISFEKTDISLEKSEISLKVIIYKDNLVFLLAKSIN